MKLCLLILFSVWPIQAQNKAQKIVKEGTKALGEGKKSQKKIDRLASETQVLLQKYSKTIQEIEKIKIYNQQLRKVIASQEEEKKSIAQQIESIKETSKGIVPLMVRMVEVLDEFMALDVPFLPQEREKRKEEIKQLLTRADVSTSEKFRRIVEAYKVENDYGRTIEAYRGIQKIGDREITVDYLRIGRIALLYQALDGSFTGRWNGQTKSWEKLPSSYDKSVAIGLKMARKQSAPQLLKVPLGI